MPASGAAGHTGRGTGPSVELGDWSILCGVRGLSGAADTWEGGPREVQQPREQRWGTGAGQV